LVCEVGTSNIFFFILNEKGEKELITPELESGLILPGVVRDSIIRLTKEWKEFKVTERKIHINEIITAIKEKRLLEAFGAGTAVIVGPISGFNYKGVDYDVPINPKLNAGELAKKILDSIYKI